MPMVEFKMKTEIISFIGNTFVLTSLVLLALKFPVGALIFSLLSNIMFIWYGAKMKHYNFILFAIIFAAIAVAGLFNYLL